MFLKNENKKKHSKYEIKIAISNTVLLHNKKNIM